MNRFKAEVTTLGGRVFAGSFEAKDQEDALSYLYSTDKALELDAGLGTHLIARHHIEHIQFWQSPLYRPWSDSHE